MRSLSQSPTDPLFVQDPYRFYRRAQAEGPVIYWQDYGMPAAFDAATVQALLRDRRLGRERPASQRMPIPEHLRDWARVEAHSMLDMEPPRHTRLRALVLRAFTSRRIQSIRPEIEAVAQDLLATRKTSSFDLITAYCTQLPVRIIARLLGVPETMWQELLCWSNAMVSMYQAGRTRAMEDAANKASLEFVDFLHHYIGQRRSRPADDLITHLIAAGEDGAKLTTDELIGTCVLLLNAGHEATVHSIGNAVKCLLENHTPGAALAPKQIAFTVEELLRYDPPLHMFTRFAYEDIHLGDLTLKKDQEVALILGAAGRDPAVYENPARFDPFRDVNRHAAFGGGIHFCVGAPLARLELQIALPAVFEAYPNLQLAETPRYAMSYHFHKMDRLMVTP
ncbi:MAG: cytochrome P450 [Pseudomonadota bacterium]